MTELAAVLTLCENDVEQRRVRRTGQALVDCEEMPVPKISPGWLLASSDLWGRTLFIKLFFCYQTDICGTRQIAPGVEQTV